MSNVIPQDLGVNLDGESFKIGEQEDGGIVDMYGNKISFEERLGIIETVGSLPVNLYHTNEIIDAVNNSSMVIIKGETGSGKTTQIPKMFYGSDKSIVVTQPRVLAAMSNASRVSQELLADTGNPNYSLGYGVGYRTGKGVSSRGLSPLSFHTDGLELMRQVMSGKTPDMLFLDEVHNFSIPTEILAMLMKYNRSVKLVIMSATLEPQIFQEYYREISSNIPVVDIKGRTFPVTPHLNPLENYIESIATHYTGKPGEKGKNILFFVPGKKEIEGNIALLKQRLGSSAQVFPLHAEMSKEEQRFLLTNTTGKPRIIVSTNVSEESITIDYIDMVVDLGTHKVLRHNHLGIDELRLEDISQANSDQRAGRAGRTHPGEYIRTNNTDYNDLPKFPEAPIEKELLDRYILILLEKGIDLWEKIKEENDKGGQLFFHNINKRLYQIALFRLRKIGAISSKGKITNLGKNLLQFPVDVYNARLVVEGIKRDCSETMVYVAAILEKKGFLSKEGAWKNIKLPGKGTSDILAYVELFKFLTLSELPNGKLNKLIELGVDKDEIDEFIQAKGEKKLYECVNLEGLGIKMRRLAEIDQLVNELKGRFESLNIPLVDTGKIDDKKICLVSGSLHNIFKYDLKRKKFKNRDHKDGDHALYFTPGNISLQKNFSSTGYYLGIPFIIGGTHGQEDFNVVTFLTKVDEGHISEIDHITPHIPSILSKSIGRLTVDEAEQNAARGIEIFEHKLHHRGFKNQEGAEDFYLNQCLPDLLVGSNNVIRKYLADKSPEQIYTFRQLITRFLLTERHRISKVNPEVTEKSFVHDSEILERFLESSDPEIIAYRRGEIFDVNFDDTKLFVEKNDLVESGANNEAFEWQKRYAALVGRAKSVFYKLDEEEVKGKFSGKLLAHLEHSSPEYNSLSLLYQKLGYVGVKETQEMCKQMKQVNRKKRKLNALHHRGGELREFKKLIETIIKNSSLVGVDEEYIKDFLKGSDFLLLQTSKILSAIETFHSKDKRKQRRAIDLLSKKFIPYITLLIDDNDDEVADLSSKVNLEDIPPAHEVKELLSVILPNVFESEYYYTMVYHQLLDLIRGIIRDHITERKGLDKILQDFIMKFRFSHVNDFSSIFNFFEDYNGVSYELSAFTGEVYQEVKQTKDVNYIQDMCKRLELKIEEYVEKTKRAKNILETIGL